MNSPIITTKLYPPGLPQKTIHRTHLQERINEGLAGQLTLISAPTGYGKTTLMAEWCIGPGNSIPQAWLSLEEGENDPIRFISYLLAALQIIQNGFGQDFEKILQGSQKPHFPSISGLLINELALIPFEFILILEDYHVIENRDIHQVLFFILEHLPPNMHITILTRSDPPWPLGRLRARGQLVEIRARDLRFNVDETKGFFEKVLSLNLSSLEIHHLFERTEGWVAGLQLAGLSIQGQENQSETIETFSSGNDYIVDYLIEEVLSRQTEDVRTFLLKTSILHRMKGSLCDEITGGSNGDATLEKLIHANMFISPIGGEDRWYRYHHLFAEVMANRLKRLHPDQVPILHLQAAQWFEKNNLIPEAIEHAFSATDYEFAAEMLEGISLEHLRNGEISTLLAWFGRIPETYIRETPQLFLHWAWTMLLAGRSEPIEEAVYRAEKHARDLNIYDELRGDFAAILAYQASMHGNLELAKEKAVEALEWVAEENDTVRSVMAFVLGGILYMRQEYPQAIASMLEAARLGERSGNLNSAVAALSAAGKMQLSGGDLSAAGNTFDRALKLSVGHRGQHLAIASSAYGGLAELHLILKDYEKARQLADKGFELGEQWANADSQVGCLLTLARIDHLEGDLKGAQSAFEKAKKLAVTYMLTPDFPEKIAGIEALLQTRPPSEPAKPSLIELLSERELEVLRLFAEGFTNQEVANRLIISLGTVKAHSSNIYRKLDVRSRTEAVIKAGELGLL